MSFFMKKQKSAQGEGKQKSAQGEGKLESSQGEYEDSCLAIDDEFTCEGGLEMDTYGVCVY